MTVVATVTASASLLDVDGTVMQIDEPEVNVPIPSINDVNSEGSEIDVTDGMVGSAPDTTDTTESATGDETAAGDGSEPQTGETSDASQTSSADSNGAPAAQGFVFSPEIVATVAVSPTVTPIPTPAPTATSIPAPTATPQPPVPGNIQSAGVPPGPTSGISWFVDTCVSTTSGDTGWEFVPSAQVGVLTAAITNGQAGDALDCVAYVANSGAAPTTVTGVIADFDPAVFALDAELGDSVTLQPCGVALEWGGRLDGVPESCWTVVPLTIRIGAAVGQDWIGIGVALASGN
jgi:hypothetical protein